MPLPSKRGGPELRSSDHVEGSRVVGFNFLRFSDPPFGPGAQ